MKPAMTFSIVDLPQPDGPSRQTNSPSPTSRLMSSSTLRLAPSRSNTMLIPSARSLAARACMVSADAGRAALVIRVAPADGRNPFERPHADIEQKPDDADHHHARNDQVVSVPGVACVHDQEARGRS